MQASICDTSTIYFPSAPQPNPNITSFTMGSGPPTPPPTPLSLCSTEFDARSPDPAQGYLHISQLSVSAHTNPTLNINKSKLLAANCDISDYCSLPSPTSPTWGSPIAHSTELEPIRKTQPASRFLFVSGIPTTADSQSLKQAFVACGDLKGICIRFQVEYGSIILAFFDVRHAVRAQSQINTRTFFDHVPLGAHFISAAHLRQLIGHSSFANSSSANLFISLCFVGPEWELSAAALQNTLASFGELRWLRSTAKNARAFYVEYFDERDATSALNALNSRVILGVRLHIAFHDPEEITSQYSYNNFQNESALQRPLSQAPVPVDTTVLHRTPPTSAPELPPSVSIRDQTGKTRRAPLQRSLSEQNLRALAKAQEDGPDDLKPRTRTHLKHIRTRCISNGYKFDAVGKAPLPPSTPPRPRSISVSSSPVAGRLELLPDLEFLSHPVAYNEPGETSPCSETASSYFGDVIYASDQPSVDPVMELDGRMKQFPGAGNDLCAAPIHEVGNGASLENNKVDIAKIERGDNTRTTVMIKNIPNKMTDRHLLKFINDVCPKKIDFLYLRMDFMTGFNVGYAFVNFIHVEDLVHFAKVKLGTKWNMFTSEKTLAMSYAHYQGKEALIEKFRSSSIMIQRESWRPKLFYSSGQKKGLPEDFPGPPHLSRKGRCNLTPKALQHIPVHFHHPLGASN